MIHDAQDAEACHGEGAYREEDLFRGLFVRLEDVIGLSDLEVPKKSSGEASSSFKLTSQFPAPSFDPGCK